MLCIFYIFSNFPHFFIGTKALPNAPISPNQSISTGHYIITDETTNQFLMRVSVTVHVGDEVLSQDNKLYEVVRIENNQAYARFVRNVKLTP